MVAYGYGLSIWSIRTKWVLTEGSNFRKQTNGDLRQGLTEAVLEYIAQDCFQFTELLLPLPPKDAITNDKTNFNLVMKA